jgi:hypothetical protein
MQLPYDHDEGHLDTENCWINCLVLLFQVLNVPSKYTELICRKTFEFEPISIDTKVKVDSVPYNSGSLILSGIYHLIFGALIILFSIGYGWTRTFLFYFISKRGPKSEILYIWKAHLTNQFRFNNMQNVLVSVLCYFFQYPIKNYAVRSMTRQQHVQKERLNQCIIGLEYFIL